LVPVQARPHRTALLVLGMHRSGTSALARVLGFLGAALPQNLMPPDRGNVAGHWEPLACVNLHDEILSSQGGSWDRVSLLSPAWFYSQEALERIEQIKSLILCEYADAPLFVVKDPRLSLIYPLWARALEELQISCKPIVAVRHPLETAQSLCFRENLDDFATGWSIDRAGLLALSYSISAERHTRLQPRVFCHYGDLLADWRGAMRRVGSRLSIIWPNWTQETESQIDEFLKCSLRHHCLPEDLAPPGGVWKLISPIYAQLRQCCFGAPLDGDAFDRMAVVCRATSMKMDSLTRGMDLKRSLDWPGQNDGWTVAFRNDAQALQNGLLLARRDQEIVELKLRNRELARQIKELVASRSWRVTAPLRYFSTLLRSFMEIEGLLGEGIDRPRPLQNDAAAMSKIIGIDGFPA
jgi:hypothetical protein